MDTPIYKGAAKRLDDIDIPRIASRIGCDEDRIHAVLDVECKGQGFDAAGRLTALFEPHIFYDRLRGKKRAQAVAAGLAYPKQGMKRYPADSYARIEAAMKIDEVAALESTSWGLPQMMGFNAKLCGFAGPAEMVKAFAQDEETQLDAMVTFIKAVGLDDELRRLDWAGFARGYNGKNYKINAYDVRLARAYAHWTKIKDTPWPPKP